LGADCSLLLNADLQRIIDQQTEPWGVKVTALEVKNVDLPQEMQRAIARQAEAKRNVAQRSFTLKANSKPPTLRRCGRRDWSESRRIATRYLQTLVEIAADKNSTTIFPIPIDTIAPFLKGLTQK